MHTGVRRAAPSGFTQFLLDVAGSKSMPTLGIMAGEALDDYIEKR
jgi:hypothetical protein